VNADSSVEVWFGPTAPEGHCARPLLRRAGATLMTKLRLACARFGGQRVGLVLRRSSSEWKAHSI
jgi:hypothetical protein